MDVVMGGIVLWGLLSAIHSGVRHELAHWRARRAAS